MNERDRTILERIADELRYIKGATAKTSRIDMSPIRAPAIRRMFSAGSRQMQPAGAFPYPARFALGFRFIEKRMPTAHSAAKMM
jgi:hypothetical protein